MFYIFLKDTYTTQKFDLQSSLEFEATFQVLCLPIPLTVFV